MLQYTQALVAVAWCRKVYCYIVLKATMHFSLYTLLDKPN